MILITGSAGYIGSQLCKEFETLKIKYIGIDCLQYSYENNIHNKKNFFKCCISNKVKISSIIKQKKIKTIIHAAAYAYVNNAENNKTNPKNYYGKTKLIIEKFLLNKKNF